MQLPAIHRNGSPPEQLLAPAREALELAQKLRAALGKMSIHGRDYYTIGDAAMELAFREHRQRMTNVEKIMANLEAYCAHCNGYVGEKL